MHRTADLETVEDFEDLLALLHQIDARYLVIGRLAFTYHAKPRYTKDMALWVGSSHRNISRINQALAEFGSPELLDAEKPGEILQLGVAPNRIDLLQRTGEQSFDAAWNNHICAPYGRAQAFWVDLNTLIAIKSAIDDPRHQEDARVLKEVRRRNTSG